MDTLLDAEFGNEHIEGGVEHVDDLGLADDRTVAVREVRDQDTQEQVRRLLLGEHSRVALTEEWGQ